MEEEIPNLTPAEHLRKAEHNEQMVAALEPHEHGFGDWSVIALFYASLHYVDCYLLNLGIRPQKHPERTSCLRNNPRLRRTVYLPYRRISRIGWLARYMVEEVSPDDVARALDDLEAIRRSLGFPRGQGRKR